MIQSSVLSLSQSDLLTVQARSCILSTSRQVPGSVEGVRLAPDLRRSSAIVSQTGLLAGFPSETLQRRRVRSPAS